LDVFPGSWLAFDLARSKVTGNSLHHRHTARNGYQLRWPGQNAKLD
jgi:hypothetical protein